MANLNIIDRQPLEFFSDGILADHVINSSTRRAMVIPIDKTPVLPSGAIIPSYMDKGKTPESHFVHTGNNAKGSNYIIPVVTDTAINAEYYNQDPYLVSVPLLRAGSRVELWRRSGTEDYFWKETAMQQNLAERDHVVKSYAASGPGKPPFGKPDMGVYNQPNEAYMQTFSPANKEISILTSKANGEPVGWHLQLNTKDGALTIISTAGDIVQVDAVNKRITLKNSLDTFIDMNKKDLFVHVPGNLKFEVGGNVEWKIGGNNTENIQGNHETNVGGSSKSIYGGNVDIQAPQHNIQAPSGKFTGQYSIGGISAVGGGGGDGNVVSKGDMKAGGDVQASGTSLKNHIHTGDDGGNTSKPQ